MKLVNHPSEFRKGEDDPTPLLLRLTTGEEIVAICNVDDIIAGNAAIGGQIDGQHSNDVQFGGFIELKMPVVAEIQNSSKIRAGKKIEIVKYNMSPWFTISAGLYVNIHHSFIIAYTTPEKHIMDRYDDLLVRVTCYINDPEYANEVYGTQEFTSIKEAEDFLDERAAKQELDEQNTESLFDEFQDEIDDEEDLDDIEDEDDEDEFGDGDEWKN